MPRLFQRTKASGHRILIVDDTEEVLESTRLLLEREGHEVVVASTGSEGIALVESWAPHLLILDYFMPGMTGEEVVKRIRPSDTEVQILLQTGYASEKPPRVMLKQLDIQGYHDKSEGPEKLLIWVDAALKAYRQIATINKSRRGLRHILDAIPEMYNLQTLEDLLAGVLEQTEGLLGGHDSLVAAYHDRLTRPDDSDAGADLLAITVNREDGLEIVAGTGRFAGLKTLAEVEPELVTRLHDFMNQSEIIEDGPRVFVPLRVGSQALGTIYFDGKTGGGHDVELLRIFAMQASQALENRRLFGMATQDDLTRTLIKRFFFRRMEEEVHEACRYEYPIALCIVDLDEFKTVNDVHGHVLGDQVLREVSRILRNGLRGHDFVGRFGGDEFVIALPHTDRRTAVDVIERLRHRVEELKIGGADVRVTLSCGVVALQDYSPPKPVLRRGGLGRMVERMLELADEMLYVSKEQGRNAVNSAPSLTVSALVEAVDSVRTEQA